MWRFVSLTLGVGGLLGAGRASTTDLVDMYVSTSRGLRVAYDPALVERVAPGRSRAFTLWYYAKPFPLPSRPAVLVDKEIARVEADCGRGVLRLLSRTQYSHKVGVDGRRYRGDAGQSVVTAGIDAPVFRAIQRALCESRGRHSP